MRDVKDLEGYEEIVKKFVGRLTLEQRLAGLTPEQRLAGLTLEQQVLALSDEVLRGLPDDYLRALPAEVREAIRRRMGRPGGCG